MSEPSTVRKALGATLFQLGWFGCVLGGDAWALAVFAGYTLLQTLIFNLSYGRFAREARLGMVCVIIGILLDTALSALHIMQWQSGQLLPELWLCVLWWMLGFGMLRYCFSWLQPRIWLAAVLGGIFGCTSYLGGARLSDTVAIQMNWDGLLILSLCWAVTMPLLVVITRYWSNRWQFRFI